LPAYYRAALPEFIAARDDTIFAALVRGAAAENLGPQYQEQVQVWDEQLPVLRAAISKLLAEVPDAAGWSVLLEFPIPRMRRRIDCVILGSGVVFVIEFKRHQDPTSADRRQVEEYCLDLRDFHQASSRVGIIPILVSGAMGSARADVAPDSAEDAARPVASLRIISRRRLRGFTVATRANRSSTVSNGTMPHISPCQQSSRPRK